MGALIYANLLVLLVLAVATIVSNVSSAERDPAHPECNEVSDNLHKCHHIVKNDTLVNPKIPKCCEGLRTIKNKLLPRLGATKTCQCVRQCVLIHFVSSDPADDLIKLNATFSKLLKICKVDLVDFLNLKAPCPSN
ncbi:hypothetical protein CCACVL1_29461 [Corchorus capsularis]|uniref:Bifunctional inhibitor/plant lipid transfer protein/seed storage helical domain-containing protein n=1 Tax=Corchorus capsularis TaxID=210143 RepID=A0A1R3G1L3_COCAP|nr:hypothetical protein CCACVL1_29461 [Corchorus capsularis]